MLKVKSFSFQQRLYKMTQPDQVVMKQVEAREGITRKKVNLM